MIPHDKAAAALMECEIQVHTPIGQPDGLLRALRRQLVSLSQRAPPWGYDEPVTPSYAISSNCLVTPDGEQA